MYLNSTIPYGIKYPFWTYICIDIQPEDAKEEEPDFEAFSNTNDSKKEEPEIKGNSEDFCEEKGAAWDLV